MIQKTFVMIKPDGIKRSISGEIITRFEKAGFKIVAMKFIHVDEEHAKKHYNEHIGKNFYQSLENFLTSGPVIAIILEGEEAIKNIRKIVGATEPHSANPGTIRGDYAHMTYSRGNQKETGINNLIHASDSEESAKKEISLWFKEEEIFDGYKTVHENFM